MGKMSPNDSDESLCAAMTHPGSSTVDPTNQIAIEGHEA